MQQQGFVDLVCRNPVNRSILHRLPELDLPQGYLVAGCLFQTVWNCLSGKSPADDILDYDIFYFDSSDLGRGAENAVIQRCAVAFSDLGAAVQVRNQARVHRWYEEKFGIPCKPLVSTCDGIDHFLNQSSCFGLREDSSAGHDIYAPFGYDDLFSMVVRPNKRRELPDTYNAKAARWQRAWPKLVVVPWTHADGCQTVSLRDAIS